MIQVLFVCLGNICRSPLAEGVFRELIKERGLAESLACDSAGTHSYHTGRLPDHRAQRVAADYNIKLTHRARKLASDDFAQFDYLVAMDESNLEYIQTQSHRSTGFDLPDERGFLFRSFDPNPDDINVPDPYYEDIAAFEEVYQIVLRCGESLLDYLVERHGLSTKMKK
jgi:protein-tyrosine phosphatase